MSVKFSFSLEYDCIGGCSHLYVEPDEYLKFKDRPLELVALHFDVMVADYLRWVEAQGRIRCIAITANKSQCKCQVAGPVLECREWVAADRAGGYCSIHGG